MGAKESRARRLYMKQVLLNRNTPHPMTHTPFGLMRKAELHKHRFDESRLFLFEFPAQNETSRVVLRRLLPIAFWF